MAKTTATAGSNTESITLEAAPEVAVALCICAKFKELQERIDNLELELSQLKNILTNKS